ncbi:MAG: hypothetical protein ILA19_01385 [Bacilli bacterium]|nr:hypothetical protein [Bacilli bacterium]
MNGLFQVGATDVCGGLLPVFRILRKGVLRIVWIGIPIILIVMGTIDLGKAVISSDDKEIKASTGRFVKRIVYAIIIFFMVTIVNLVMDIITNANDKDMIKTDDWRACWQEAGK